MTRSCTPTPLRHWTHLLGLLLALGLGLAATPALAGSVPKILATAVGTLRGGMLGPTDVAVGPDDRVYVLDGVNQRIVVYSATGQRQSSIGGFGGMATGLDVSWTGKIYVADPSLHRVRVLSAGGGVVGTWTFPAGPEGPADPTDVVVAEDQGVAYVIDNDNHRVLVVDLGSGSLRRTIGSEGKGRGQYRYPFLGDYDSTQQRVMVVEVLNTRVQVIAAGGTRTFGTFGVNRGQLFRPKGVAVDDQGRAWVTDSYLGVIQLFGTDGSFVGALGDAGSGGLVKMTTPTGVAIDSRGRLYIVESMKNQVRVYALPGGSPP